MLNIPSTSNIYFGMTKLDIPPKLDCDYTMEKITSELKRYFQETGIKRGVIGLSGGLDSSTTLALLTRAIGVENTYVYIMPSRATPKESIEYAIKMIESLDIPQDNWRKIDIEPLIRCFDGVLAFQDQVIRGNTMARIRMTLLYAEAKRLNAIVVGTGDKSELLIGYYTKYGDGGVDILPIGDIYKTQLRELAIKLGVPREIAYKPSSPELWKGHKAEEEIGLTYERIDGILYLFYDLNKKKEEILEYGFDEWEVDLVLNRYYKSIHKRTMPPIIKINDGTT